MKNAVKNFLSCPNCEGDVTFPGANPGSLCEACLADPSRLSDKYLRTREDNEFLKTYRGPEEKEIKEACPFCATKGNLIIVAELYDKIVYRVKCLDCQTEGPLIGNLTPRQAVKSWDERSLAKGNLQDRLHGAVVNAHSKYGCADGFAAPRKPKVNAANCIICEIGNVLLPRNTGSHGE